MERGCGCTQARDEIMVKAWCVPGAYLCASYATTRRWLGGHVDHLGSWIDSTFQDRRTGESGQERRRVAALFTGVGTGADRACAVSRSAGAPKQPWNPTRPRQPTRVCSRAPAALGAPAKETRHRVTVCPSARLPAVLPVFLQSNPRPAGPPEREGRETEKTGVWSQETGSQGERRTQGDSTGEVSPRKGPERRGDMQHSEAPWKYIQSQCKAPCISPAPTPGRISSKTSVFLS